MPITFPARTRPSAAAKELDRRLSRQFRPGESLGWTGVGGHTIATYLTRDLPRTTVEVKGTPRDLNDLLALDGDDPRRECLSAVLVRGDYGDHALDTELGRTIGLKPRIGVHGHGVCWAVVDLSKAKPGPNIAVGSFPTLVLTPCTRRMENLSHPLGQVPRKRPLQVPVAAGTDPSSSQLGLAFTRWRQQRALVRLLDLEDLGVTEPDQQIATLSALWALVNANPDARGVEVDGQPLEHWARDLLALSEARERWRRRRERAQAPKLPAPRLIKTHRAAEEYAAEVMAGLGLRHVAVTAPGSDGGVDVVADKALAQVKMEGVATGRPVVQNIYGVAAHAGKQAYVFSLAGYTKHALAWAEQAGVACFEFEIDGSISARTPVARDLLARGPSTRLRLASDPGSPPAPTAFPHVLESSAEFGHLLKERRLAT